MDKRPIIKFAGVWVILALVAMPLVGCDKKDTAEQAGAKVEPGPPPVLEPGTALATGWTVVNESTLTAEQTERLGRARAAQKHMGGALKTELKGAIESGGHSKAIEVCSKRAPAIAKEVATADNVSIGRTSHKLRNPKNTAPGWLTPIVASGTEVPTVVEGPNETIAVATPLFVDGLCLDCHGADDWRVEGVDSVLSELYPDDQATGFEPGDLRGYIWVVADK